VSDSATIIALKARAVEIPAPAEKEVVYFDTTVIKQVLPHREQHLLLDTAVIFPDRVVGRLEIGLGRCMNIPFKRGLKAGQPVFRSHELIDMAAQLLGVRCSRFPELTFKKLEIAIESNGPAKYIRPIGLNDAVEMVIKFSDTHVWQIERNRKFLLEGKEFIVTVSGDRKAVIHDILLMSTV